MADQLRYFFDEHTRSAIAEQLGERGTDVLTTAEAERASRRISDIEQLRFATQQGRVLVTEDSDYVAHSVTQRPHAGIVCFPIQLGIGACVEYLELLARTTEPHEMQDQLLYGHW